MRLRAAAVAVGAIALVSLGLGSLAAGAATGRAGPIDVQVSPTSGVRDGQTLSITAQAPRGDVIYELRAHLCVPGPVIRTGFDFGFQGRRCTSIAVGHGDVEQKASYGGGVTTASLNTFKVGEGTVQWVNELGFPDTITCGAGHPCDLVVRIEITNDAVFFTAPLCYGAACQANGDGGSTTTPNPDNSSPTSSPTSIADIGGGSSRTGTGSVTGSASKSAGLPAGSAGGAGGPDAPGGSHNGDASSASGSSAASRHVLSQGSHVLTAALAGMLAGGWIVSIFIRGEGWIAFAIAKRRRHRPPVQVGPA